MNYLKKLISLAKNSTLPPIDPHQLQQILNLEKQSESTGFNTMGFFTTLGIACFALLMAFLVLALIYVAAKKKPKKSYSNVPQNAQELLAAHYSKGKVNFESNGMCGLAPESRPPPRTYE